MTATIPPPLDADSDVGPGPGSAASPPGAVADPTELNSSAPSELASQLVDAAVISGLGLLGLFGFSAAYGGSRYLVTGAVGLLIGVVVALLGARRHWGIGAVGLATIAAFFLFGSAVALRQPQVAGLVPTPVNVADLLDGATQGWARLSTTYPPVGSRLNLLVVPYLCGLLCTVIGVSVAVRSRRPMWAALSPVTVLILSILFGTAQPASVVLQGAVFAVVLIGWWSHVYRQRRRVDVGGRDTRRWLPALATLLAACLISVGLGELGLIPGMGSRPRVVLRDLTEPPFDPADYPSPLNGYRRFTNGELLPGEPDSERIATTGWRSTELFEVRGLPPEQRLRLATLDSYDGTVFKVTAGGKGSGRFEPVGQTLPPAPPRHLDPELQRDRDERDVTIEVLEGSEEAGAYQDIWVPLPEGASSLEISSDDEARTETLAEGVQYNAVTGTAALPQRLAPGDRLHVQAEVPLVAGEKVLAAWREAAGEPETDPSVVELEQVAASSRAFSTGTFCTPTPSGGNGTEPASTPSPYELAERVARQLIECGAFSDGGSLTARVNPGHNAWRLDRMLSNDSEQTGMFGNGEQYAALAALIADSAGVPARVVMGFRSETETDKWREAHQVEARSDPEGTYVVTGSDVTAWIEVDLEGAGWVPVYDLIPDKEVPEQRPQPQAPKPENVPPPPPPSIPPGEESEANTKPPPPPPPPPEGFQIPGWVFKAAGAALAPVAMVGGFTALIAGLKSRRRNRRRESGSPDARIAGGWDEVKDLAADLGEPVPVRMTRSEEAAFIGTDSVRRLAGHADGLVFGPASADGLPVKQYWDEVDAARSSMVAGLSRFTRWKALVNLASLRRPSRGRPTAAVGRQSISAGAVRSGLPALPGRSASKVSP